MGGAPFFSHKKSNGPKLVSSANSEGRYISVDLFTNASNELWPKIARMFSSGTKALKFEAAIVPHR
jgi:hypothetical protein